MNIISRFCNNPFGFRKNILVALDRDGTLIHDDEGYFGKKDNWQEEVRFYEGVVGAIKTLNDFAYVIVATNQIGVARGFYGLERVKEINQFVGAFLRQEGARIDAWYFSPYVERNWAARNGLNSNSPWIVDNFPETRKPRIGMLKLAAEDLGKDLSFFKKIYTIGDSLDDLNMALNASGIGIFFANGENNHLIGQVKSLELANPGRIFLVDSLISAAEIIKSNK